MTERKVYGLPFEWREMETDTAVIGSGAAGFAAASRLYDAGQKNMVLLTENVRFGTSRNTGSDKQTYYKLSMAGEDLDSVRNLAEDLFAGQCVDGDIAMTEAALSVRCFCRLVELGVPFPCSEYGEYIGYKTDHDRGRRATSAGPYTSRLMTECLEQDVRKKEIRILDHTQAIRLLVHEGHLCGILCLERTCKPSYLVIWCKNAVLAAGGPGGMYRDSVYPQSQLGSSGIAFLAGAKGKNLTEWQYGLASVKPRWNVSGTYMQVLPRFVSAKADGSDEREFLRDFFKTEEEMLASVFLKGYQWPFDVNKIFGGSSVIDLLVYQETILRGRRVWLDFRENPGRRDVNFKCLPDEARTYLEKAGACFGTPLDRLLHMNKPAVDFYLEHGVDLSSEMLEIRICAQHNNGGLAADKNWETDIEGLFAAGEVCGTHGVTRPGGTALNAGQAGALKAADTIARRMRAESMTAGGDRESSMSDKTDREICRAQAEEMLYMTQKADGTISPGQLWQRASARMSRAGGMIRSREQILNALQETETELEHFTELVKRPEPDQLSLFFHLYDMLTAQKVYLAAMADYIEHGGESRGSALYTCPAGKLPAPGFPELYRCRLDQGRLRDQIQEICLKEDGGCDVSWRKVRPLPGGDYFFETEWRAYRERYGL
ncbi:MAG: FAD-binding protein [Eubacteriales bacterium]|nr:FAD-binding protein [Eubacteriales bacterium]